MSSAFSISVENMACIGEVLVLVCLFQVIWTKSIEKQKQPISKECREHNVCENVEDYPKDLARKLISELKNQGVFFDQEQLVVEISLRSGLNFDEGTPLCNYTIKTITPKKLEDEYGKPQLILNDNVNPTYSFVTQLCQDVKPLIGNNSSGSLSPFPSGYTAECIQRYKLRQFYFINQRNESSIGYFRVPTTCVCGLK